MSSKRTHVEEPEAQSRPAFVESASDDRTANNAVRHQYRVLSDAEKDHMVAIKDAGVKFLQACQAGVRGRHLTLAETKIEEAVMWAVKGLTQ